MKKLTLEQAKDLIIAHLKKEFRANLKANKKATKDEKAEMKEVFYEDMTEVEQCDTLRDLWISLQDNIFDGESWEVLNALIYEPKTKRIKGK